MKPVTLAYPTDTAYPQTIVPIYFIHSVAQPFCANSACWCQKNKAQVSPLLQAIQTGTLLLTQAEEFTTERVR